MTKDQLNYALAKQLDPDSNEITFHSNYGEFQLTGLAAKKAIGALRLILQQDIESGNYED